MQDRQAEEEHQKALQQKKWENEEYFKIVPLNEDENTAEYLRVKDMVI